MVRPSRYVASFDSASAMVRALARYLHGQDFPGLGTAPSVPLLAKGVNALPDRVREAMYVWGGWSEAIRPEALHEVSAGDIAGWVTGSYPRRTYPAAMIGSSDGAAMHLCAALGIPWLPQTVLVPVRRAGISPDDPRGDMARGAEPGRRLLDANPDLQLHHMHDPNQDRLMIQRMTYFRVKRRRLGAAWQRFLEQSLAPGATIFTVECQRTWPTTQVGERHFFQFGAMGGLEPAGYYEPDPRVADYLQRYGSPQQQWDPPPPDGERPEAEWGFEPALRADVERLAPQRGYRVRRIVYDDPVHLSPLVADLYRWWYRQRGIQANRLLVESFLLVEPWWTLRTGSVPFWTKFAVESSAALLDRYLDQAEPYDEIGITLFSHGVESAGIAPLERWRASLRRARERGSFVGVDERRFPRDFGVFVRFHEALKALPPRYALPGPWHSTSSTLSSRSAGKTMQCSGSNTWLHHSDPKEVHDGLEGLWPRSRLGRSHRPRRSARTSSRRTMHGLGPPRPGGPHHR